MKYYIISGEASGDLHGSNLIKALHKKDPAAEFRCWGGDKMQAAGATLVKHYRELAFMGFTEVLMNLRTIFRNLAFCKSDILEWQPTTLILVDYPGFNLRIAKWAKEQGFKVIYYISPQVWAWKENRVKMMKQCIDKMICILPFEKNYYKEKWNWEVDYVGHPLVEVVEGWEGNVDRWPLTVDRNEANTEQRTTNNEQRTSNIIALLPGSRKQEILKKLPIMLEVAKHFTAYRFIVAKAPGLEDAFYDDLLKSYTNVGSVSDQTYPLLSSSTAALVTSGTATLETALFGVPEVICYKGNALSFQIAKRLVNIKFIGLVNLIMDKEVVKELVQDDLTVENLEFELNRLLSDPVKQEQVKKDYNSLKELLSKGGHASDNAAEIVVGFLSTKDRS